MAELRPVEGPEDPRVADFVGLRGRSAEADCGWLVAEGPLVVRQLLASDYPLRSILVTERGLRALAPELEALDGPVLVADQSVLDAVCGFHFHRGALASADRRPLPHVASVATDADLLLLVEGVNDHENLGALFRNAAAFGVDAVVLDATCADPLYRRSVRVSMGHVLRLPFTRVADWPSALPMLRELGFETVALTPAADAENVGGLAPRRKRALLVGSEGPGLTAAALAAADRRVRVPIAPGVDSLNVATAAAVALHRLAPPR
ncbi:MAG TPA: RNA methyltransferase [Acidimicrobiales bacterium]|nr:RNA methyltransferase [Acidimicrobiales bacterium]